MWALVAAAWLMSALIDGAGFWLLPSDRETCPVNRAEWLRVEGGQVRRLCFSDADGWVPQPVPSPFVPTPTPGPTPPPRADDRTWPHPGP